MVTRQMLCLVPSVFFATLHVFSGPQLDFPAFGNNIEEYMQSTGNADEVKRGSAPDLTPEVIEKFDVAMGKDGVLTLSPKGGVDEEAPSSS